MKVAFSALKWALIIITLAAVSVTGIAAAGIILSVNGFEG